jgi:NTE family protein
VPTGHGRRDSLRDKGMMWVLNQAIRIGMQRLIDESIQRVTANGDVHVLLLQAAPEDGVLFMYNPASFESRRRMLEHAYRSTRAELSRRFARGDETLQRAGFIPRPGARSASLPP